MPDSRLTSVEVPSPTRADRKSTRLNSSHLVISYAVFCLTKTLLNQPFLLASTVLLHPDLLRIPPAHTERGRQFAQTSLFIFLGIQRPQTKFTLFPFGPLLV